ncbi:MAG: hypothetical protein ACOYZ8_09840 [Chloroflexota bacterium]
MARKRKKHADKNLLENFSEEVMSEHKDMKFLLNPKGEISMSDAISQLIEPFRDDAPNFDSFSNLVTFGCIAWNTSILSENQRNEALEKMIDLIPGKMEDRLEILNLLGELMERKRRLFPNNTRTIIEHKVTDRGNDFHIAIASTMEKKDTAK